MPVVGLEDFIASVRGSRLAAISAFEPWEATSQSEALVSICCRFFRPDEFTVADEVAVHRTTTVEAGAVLKGPLILEANCFVASGAYLRGGCWVAERCIFGPGAELKSSFVFGGTKLGALQLRR